MDEFSREARLKGFRIQYDLCQVALKKARQVCSEADQELSALIAKLDAIRAEIQTLEADDGVRWYNGHSWNVEDEKDEDSRVTTLNHDDMMAAYYEDKGELTYTTRGRPGFSGHRL